MVRAGVHGLVHVGPCVLRARTRPVAYARGKNFFQKNFGLKPHKMGYYRQISARTRTNWSARARTNWLRRTPTQGT